MNIGSNYSLIPVTIGLILLIFGALYDQLVTHLHRQGYSEGYTALLVAAGVLVTVTAAGLVIGWLNAVWLLIFFVCSGSPMIIGDIRRHVKARHEFEQRTNGQ